MKNKIYFFLFWVLCISCHKEVPIPSYIHIDKMNLTTLSTQGTNSQKIVDAWVYVDNDLIGAFEMPCTFPVLYSGKHTVKIFPGIKENGVAATRIQYPFYSDYETDVTLTAGQKTFLTPTITYSPIANFLWLEDFEAATHTLCKSDFSNDTTYIKITKNISEVFEGTGSGKVELTSGGYYGVSCSKYAVASSGNIFLELNYNCNTEFTIGIQAYDSGNNLLLQTGIVALLPTTGWDKAYVNLATTLRNAGAEKFAVYIAMKKDDNLSSSYLYIDNLKVID
ncbi:MAG: hypothetical protein HY063_13285 [Bacteroidetes bacterium]|nr:hypothetical protein [Bacteroidota bacterium]